MRLKSPEVLRQYMEYKRLTVRELAAAAKVSRATVGHLRSGERNTAKPATARAIEEALGCPPGLLFEARTSSVAREVAA